VKYLAVIVLLFGCVAFTEEGRMQEIVYTKDTPYWFMFCQYVSSKLTICFDQRSLHSGSGAVD